MLAAGVPGRGRIFERERPRIGDLVDHAQRVAEILLALARETDDEVRRECEVGTRNAHARDDLEIIGAAVPPVHGGEDAVGARLHGRCR
jgi:hypothetical protein